MSFALLEAQEVHLTVDLGGSASEVLSALAREHGCRFFHVLLDAGVHPSQPMLSWRQAAGIDSALKRAGELARAVELRGMTLTRVKVEVKPELAVDPLYFEAHFKLELAHEQLPELQSLAQALGVHISRNAVAHRGGKQRRFLTARAPTLASAFASFDRVESALASGGWQVLSADREAVIYDSNLALDEGWST